MELDKLRKKNKSDEEQLAELKSDIMTLRTLEGNGNSDAS